MKKVKIMSINIIIIFLVITMFLTACTTNNAKKGTYYSEQSNESYIKISSTNKIEFCNINFEWLQKQVDELNIDVDVAKKLSSQVNYNISENLDKLFVDLIGELKLTLNYNYDNGIIILNNISYKLKN